MSDHGHHQKIPVMTAAAHRSAVTAVVKTAALIVVTAVSPVPVAPLVKMMGEDANTLRNVSKRKDKRSDEKRKPHSKKH